MTEYSIELIALVVIFSGVPLGLFLQRRLPGHHLSQELKDIVKLGAGVIATLAALVLGLLVSAAKGSFDARNGEVLQNSVKTLLQDEVLEQYGPEAKQAR